jgi:hypothetical protein
MSHQEHTHTKKIKIVVYVPESHADAVRDAIGSAGGGKIGNYSHCTFTTKGTGRFMPLAGANPSEGTIGQLSVVAEDKIETVCLREDLENVLSAIEQAHPYEEPAIDIYPIEEIDKK